MKNKLYLLVVIALVGLIGVIGFKVPKPNVGGNYRENTKEIAILTATTTQATSTMESVVYYRNLGITVATESASGTLKFYCSLYDDQPDLDSSASATNPYDTVEIVDTQNGSSIDGDTGITLTNTTDVRQFEVNGNNFRWCGAILLGTVNGTTTVKFKPADNS